MQVVSAVGEAFNNVVLHGYAGRKEASIDLRIQTRRGLIRIELRDWGSSFDPTTVAPRHSTPSPSQASASTSCSRSWR